MQEKSINRIITKKRESKRELAEILKFSRKKALVAVFLDKELDEWTESRLNRLFEAMKNIKAEVVVLADPGIESLLSADIKILPYSRQNRNLLLHAADMALALDGNDLEEMLMNGVIPVSMGRPEIKDYNPNRETGNSFVYREENPWAAFAALVRATETFRFPYDWKHIIREGIRSVKD